MSFRSAAQILRVALLPASLVAFHILRISIETGVSPFAMVRPLLVGLAIALLLAATSLLLVREAGRATVIATFATFAVMVWSVVGELAVAGAAAVVVVAVLPRLLRTPFPWRLIPPATTALAVVLVGSVAIRAVEAGTIGNLPRDAGWALRGLAAPRMAAASSDPDVYLLMLEDYPRADVLQRVFGFDNGPFLSALADRGFIVSPHARSSYSNTAFSLLTLFQARHVAELPEMDAVRDKPASARYPVVRRLMNEGAPLALLRARGYEIIAADPGYEQLTLRSADRFFEPPQMTDLEFDLLSTSVGAPLADALVPSFVGMQARDRIAAEFRFLGDVAGSVSDHPRFVFVHIPIPHLPVVFGAEGQSVDVKVLAPRFDQLADPRTFPGLYAGQIRYLNGLTLAAVDRISASSRPSLVVVTSDEGLGYVMMSATTGQPADAVRFLFAARSPDGVDLFGPSITSVNVFPTIFERFFGGGVARRSDRVFVSSDIAPFEGFELPDGDL